MDAVTISVRDLLIEKTQYGREQWSKIIPEDYLYETLHEFEANGLLGIRFSVLQDHNYKVEAWKAQPENCYDTGRIANFRGNSLAVVDDDHHFIFKQIKICEKTANVYMLPTYQGILEVTKPDPALYSRLSTNPVLFDCDTLDKDAASLSEQIAYQEEKDEQSLLYPGPFRFIILQNGTILRRGIPVSVSAQSARMLSVEHCIPLSISAPVAQNFQELYRKYGAIFLVGDYLNLLPDLKKIGGISDVLKQRLANMIDKKNEYFLMQGSDPEMKDSCCPNPLVGELKGLVNAGIVTAWGAATANSCPMTTYAFAGEIILNENSFPSFTKNEFLRKAIRKYL